MCNLKILEEQITAVLLNERTAINNKNLCLYSNGENLLWCPLPMDQSVTSYNAQTAVSCWYILIHVPSRQVWF